jgi:glutathione synthase/RimK-type ligase-like ATP-grasp enzyme
MILLWGLLEDETFASVTDWLTRWHADFAFINHAAIARTTIRFRSHPQPSYELTSEGSSYSLDNVKAAYLRPYDYRDYDECEEPRPRISRASLVHQFMNIWSEYSSALIINRPSAVATNHSKLAQAINIRASGFLVPDSLVTNDQATIHDFLAHHGSVIYKSMSSVRSIVKELDPAILDVVGRLGPIFLQQRIVGDNIRVHVIEERTVACRVHSQAVDYRYAPSRIAPFDLPEEIAARCVQLTKQLGLVLSGIDLIVTPRGEYHCLEVNPNPAFSYFDSSDEKTIARHVAEILLRQQELPR